MLIHIAFFVVGALSAGALGWEKLRPYLIDAGFLVITSPGHTALTMPWLGGRPVLLDITHLIALAVGATGLLAAHLSLTRRRRLCLEASA